MKLKISNILVAVIAGLFVTQSAFAVDGRITVKGQITDTTCSIAVNGGSKDATVTLPTISVNALTSADSVAGTTPFNIVLSGCTGDTMDNAYAYFEPGDKVEISTGRLKNDGTATGVQVRLLNKQAGPIVIGSASQNDVVEDISGGSATLEYFAQYYANTGSITAGTVMTYVDYTIVYD